MEKSVLSYSKVNIGLRVLGKREDGFHDLDSYFLRIPFTDTLHLKLEERGEGVSIRGNGGYLDNGATDTMEKAARLYMEKSGIPFSLSIEIEKHIPVKAGLGGGSGNAAAVLLFLEDVYGALGAGLGEVGRMVGADVPFFLSGLSFARVGGVGDRLERAEWNLPYRYISLFRGAGKGVSTREAFSRLDERAVVPSLLPVPSYPLLRSDFPNDFEILSDSSMLSVVSGYMEDGDYISLSGSGDVWFLLSRSKVECDAPEFIGSRELVID